MNLSLDMEFREGVLFVRLKGELDHHTSDLLREKIAPIIDEYRIRFLVLNLNELEFMDSSGLGVILGRYNQINRSGGKVVVCGLNKYLEQIFRMSGIFDVIDYTKNEDNAIEYLGV